MKEAIEVFRGFNPRDHSTDDFNLIYEIIQNAHKSTYQQVNTLLISLYWMVGQYVSLKINKEEWNRHSIQALADYIYEKNPFAKSFSARNIRRMKLFYETYQADEQLLEVLTEKWSAVLTEKWSAVLTEKWSAVLTELNPKLKFKAVPKLLVNISWTNHMHILSKVKETEERAYYLGLAAKNGYSERDLARLIDTGTYHRTKIADHNMSPALKNFPADTSGIFKDSYIFEFLQLPDSHQEADLRKGLVNNLKHFLLELGPDFTLMGQEFMVQVGNKDFRIDLLMFHRGMNCMVAVELKTGEFKPEHLGQLQFYLEALDTDIKKTHENPSVGILICSTKDEEVVKYALNRHMSPTMIADYETKLISRELLQRKIHEISQMLTLEGYKNED